MATFAIEVLSTSSTTNGWRMSGTDRSGTINSSTSNPDITIDFGDAITFTFNNTSSHPFEITGDSSINGRHSGQTDGFTPSIPDTYFYECTNHPGSMNGVIVVLNATTTSTTPSPTTSTTSTTSTTTTNTPTTSTTTSTTTTSTTSTTTTTTTAAPCEEDFTNEFVNLPLDDPNDVTKNDATSGSYTVSEVSNSETTESVSISNSAWDNIDKSAIKINNLHSVAANKEDFIISFELYFEGDKQTETNSESDGLFNDLINARKIQGDTHSSAVLGQFQIGTERASDQGSGPITDRTIRLIVNVDNPNNANTGVDLYQYSPRPRTTSETEIVMTGQGSRLLLYNTWNSIKVYRKDENLYFSINGNIFDGGTVASNVLDKIGDGIREVQVGRVPFPTLFSGYVVGSLRNLVISNEFCVEAATTTTTTTTTTATPTTSTTTTTATPTTSTTTTTATPTTSTTTTTAPPQNLCIHISSYDPNKYKIIGGPYKTAAECSTVCGGIIVTTTTTVAPTTTSTTTTTTTVDPNATTTTTTTTTSTTTTSGPTTTSTTTLDPGGIIGGTTTTTTTAAPTTSTTTTTTTTSTTPTPLQVIFTRWT